MDDLLLHVHGAVASKPSPRGNIAEPLKLALCTPPHKPRRYKIVQGSFVVLAFGETRSGAAARFRFEPMAYVESRSLWRVLLGQGRHAEWVRSDRVPACPPDVIDATDLAELWRVQATQLREQLEMTP